ncbi:MAG TPA: FAD-dependent oxidoreductase [Kiritimatiellia bacterium]|nr:FAD-dependent oxidoreductase [Kiritimatiellia bacterium]
MIPPGSSIAVVGAGVAGITSAHLLQKHYRVTLIESETRLGGHTNTVTLPSGPDAGTPVDTGFIVLNDKNYPLLHRLLQRLNVPWRWSDMSFAYASTATGDCYCGDSLPGLFARRSNLLRPSHYLFIAGILRFSRRALRDLETEAIGDITLADYLARVRCPEPVIRKFIIPMAAAIWSAPQRDIQEFPAATLLHFWRNHGLLSLKDRPVWQTVVGGSSAYVHAFRKTFTGTLITSDPVVAITRRPEAVDLRTQSGQALTFDAVILATHADQALRLLTDPTPQETNLLGPWRYQPNHTVLHTDTSFLPANPRAWASWNYVEHPGADPAAPVPVTYNMNRLQGFNTSATYCVTLNPTRPIPEAHHIASFNYTHPVYSREAVATQPDLPSINGKQRTWFCGSYFGYGFHEDAVRSADHVAADFEAESL